MISISEIKRAIFDLSKKKKENKLFQDFLESFFSYIPFDDLSKKHVEDLYAIAELSYKFFRNRTNDQSVYILTHNDSEVGLSKGEIVVILLNNDMAFLVDSITECFNRKKYRVQKIVNATLNVSRLKNGDLSMKSKQIR